MAKKAKTKQTFWQHIPKAIYGILLGTVVGTAAVVYDPKIAGTLLVGLITIAAYIFFLTYRQNTLKAFSSHNTTTPVIGALVIGTMSIAGVQYLGSSNANSIYNTNSPNCAAAVIGNSNQIGRSNSQFYESGNNTASTVVVVRGDANCEKTITLASWTAPYDKASFLPIASQKLFTSKSYKLKPGTHILSVSHADCLYQIDMLFGSAVTTPWGDANYPADQKLGWVQAGHKICSAPVSAAPASTTPTPTPTPTTDPIPTPFSPPPTVLPKTGPGNIITIVLIAGVTGYLFSALYRLSGDKDKRA